MIQSTLVILLTTGDGPLRTDIRAPGIRVKVMTSVLPRIGEAITIKASPRWLVDDEQSPQWLKEFLRKKVRILDIQHQAQAGDRLTMDQYLGTELITAVQGDMKEIAHLWPDEDLSRDYRYRDSWSFGPYRWEDDK